MALDASIESNSAFVFSIDLETLLFSNQRLRASIWNRFRYTELIPKPLPAFSCFCVCSVFLVRHWKANSAAALVIWPDEWADAISAFALINSQRKSVHSSVESSNTHLIFLRRILFSLSRFFSVLMNWLKNSSWSFLFWTCLNRGSFPYFSENSLNVDLQNEEEHETWDAMQSQSQKISSNLLAVHQIQLIRMKVKKKTRSKN